MIHIIEAELQEALRTEFDGLHTDTVVEELLITRKINSALLEACKMAIKCAEDSADNGDGFKLGLISMKRLHDAVRHAEGKP